MTKPKEGAKKGPPTLYHIDKIIDAIAERMSKGETLKSICQSEGMPSLRRLQELTADRPDYRAILVSAREAGAEYLASSFHEEMEELLAKAKEGDGVDKSVVDVMRLYSTHIQWLTARMSPKRFSERVLAEMAKQPEPIKDVTPEVDTTHMTYEERETLRQLILAAERRKNAAVIEYKEAEANDRDE